MVEGRYVPRSVVWTGDDSEILIPRDLGEKAYNDNQWGTTSFFSSNQYQWQWVSPYGNYQGGNWGGPKRPIPECHARWIHATIDLNNKLNREAQAAIDAKEPKSNIWDDDALNAQMSQLNVGDKKKQPIVADKKGQSIADYPEEKIQQSAVPFSSNGNAEASVQKSKLSKFRQSIGIKSSDERQMSKAIKAAGKDLSLRNAIVEEEQGRWPDAQWRDIVAVYQEKSGMTKKIADLRARYPIQYLHLLRAGYFEPIPVAWADSMSNPLKFSIEAAAGWRGLTPAWRGYEDTAEERLYWVLNHRQGSTGKRLKPDFISALKMACDRMATAVEPPPQYYSANDTCHTQHTSTGYSKQVMPPPFQAFDRPEVATDDTMILLDVSGSMDFTPLRPTYDRYLVTGYSKSGQPKNKGRNHHNPGYASANHP